MYCASGRGGLRPRARGIPRARLPISIQGEMMSKRFTRLTTLSLGLAAIVAVGLSSSPAGATGPASGVIFDSIPSALPGNVASVGFEATSTAEFGDYATFDTGNPSRLLQNVDVVMSSWGCESGHWNTGDCSTTPGATFSHPITLTLYQNNGGAPGSEIAQATQTFAIPFRPSADPGNCTGADGGKWFDSASSTCYNGFATTLTFDFSSQNVTLPTSVIYGISYNTTHYGANPIGESASCFSTGGGCGYDSLNIGAEASTPSVGSDDDPNGVFQNSSSGSSYCDGGTSGTGAFRLDTGCWAGFNPLVRFNAASLLGACPVSDDGSTLTLLADCTTDHTLLVPNGYTFDGNGHTITAIDPGAGHFLGAILANAGTTANVRHVTLTTSGLMDACDGGAGALRGILLDGASGSISNNTVQRLEQGADGQSGCQEGNAIDVRNTAGTGQPSVTISGNTVSGYQKTGILATGSVAASITNNTVTGDGAIAYIAQNGIQISDGATATLTANTVSANNYTPPKVTACGLLLFKAGGVSASKNGISSLKSDNTISGNETDVCNFGKGGGFDPAN